MGHHLVVGYASKTLNSIDMLPRYHVSLTSVWLSSLPLFGSPKKELCGISTATGRHRSPHVATALLSAQVLNSARCSWLFMSQSRNSMYPRLLLFLRYHGAVHGGISCQFNVGSVTVSLTWFPWQFKGDILKCTEIWWNQLRYRIYEETPYQMLLE